jgi:hypothetical protein
MTDPCMVIDLTFTNLILSNDLLILLFKRGKVLVESPEKDPLNFRTPDAEELKFELEDFNPLNYSKDGIESSFQVKTLPRFHKNGLNDSQLR